MSLQSMAGTDALFLLQGIYVKGGRERLFTGGLGDLRTNALKVSQMLAEFCRLARVFSQWHVQGIAIIF